MIYVIVLLYIIYQKLLLSMFYTIAPVFLSTFLLSVAATNIPSGGNQIVCSLGHYNMYLELAIRQGIVSSRRRRRRRPLEVICVPCLEGRYQSAMEHGYFSCNACPSGKYQPNKGKGMCIGTSCPVGRYGPIAQTTADQATCNDCDVGKYSSVEGYGPQCNNCEPGRYQSQKAQTDCQGSLCIPGKYGPLVSNTQEKALCKSCSLGKFTSEVGQNQCLVCPDGKYNTLEKETSCKDIPSCSGIAEHFNMDVYACTITNEKFKFIIPIAIALTIVQFILACSSGYLIIFINFIINMGLTIHYGMPDKSGKQSDASVWCIFTYMIISFLWSVSMIFLNGKSGKKYGDECKCCPF